MTYQLTFFGATIHSLGDLLDALETIQDPEEEINYAKQRIEFLSHDLGCFKAYETYLTERFGEPTRHDNGRVSFCD